MPELVADFHIHSRYSRACSKDLSVKELAKWAKIKGIGVLGTGDFTHPLWLQELKEQLRPTGQGLLERAGAHFMLTSEVNTIFYVQGRAHQIHHILLAPSFETVDRINRELEAFGSLAFDGRPILHVEAERLVEIVTGVDPRAAVVPAHCLPPDSYIHTDTGITKIQDIRVGDLVYSHSGQLRPVTEIHARPYRGPLYHIRPFYFRLGLETTPEHPFYVVKTYKHCAWTKGDCRPTCAEKGSCRKRPYEHYTPQWVPAREIERGDVLVFPRFVDVEQDVATVSLSQQMSEAAYRRYGELIAPVGTKVTKVPETVPVDTAFCRLMGYYLAEGYTDGHSHVSFCFRDDETAYMRDVQEIMRRRLGVSLTGTRNHSDNRGVELIYSSKILHHFFSQQFYWNGHKTAAYKALPQWALRLPRPKQAEIVRGWWRGDTGYTSSRVLMNQFKVLLLRLGIIPSILVDRAERHRERGRHEYAGRTIRAQHDSFQFSNLSFFDDAFGLLSDPAFQRFKTKMSRRHGWVDDHYIYIPVRDVSVRSYEGPVHNLEVAGDNSYVAEFATVHNCWTPHFSVFGSNSGFDTIEACFGKQTDKIFALETGLSSDPAMNWRLSALDRYALISNSDSHSARRIGREANVFDCALAYDAILDAIRSKDPKKFLYTVEFFPEEGKYHYDGHRNCRVSLHPKDSKKRGLLCPVCNRKVTVGVMHRVEDLADRPEGASPPKAIPFKSSVPLDEIISDAVGKGTGTQTVDREYFNLIERIGSEFEVLLKASEEQLRQVTSAKIADGILRMRRGEVSIDPGYDGEYGKVKIFAEAGASEAARSGEQQMTLF